MQCISDLRDASKTGQRRLLGHQHATDVIYVLVNHAE